MSNQNNGDPIRVYQTACKGGTFRFLADNLVMAREHADDLRRAPLGDLQICGEGVEYIGMSCDYRDTLGFTATTRRK